MNMMIEKAINFAIDIAKDDSHGYDQINRWSPDFDCSSLVISSFESAGLKVREAGASYTGNMRRAFEKCGFKSIPYSKGMILERGDVLLNEQYHTAMYLGDGQIVQASINEQGKATGGKTGDQTGREIYVGAFYEYSKGWQCVLRYEEDVDIKMPVLTNGSVGVEVGLLQTLLNELGYKGTNGRSLVVDHAFGGNTLNAVKSFQLAHGMNDDGIVGLKTWTALLKENY